VAQEPAQIIRTIMKKGEGKFKNFIMNVNT
jgi:hypothetical protein